MGLVQLLLSKRHELVLGWRGVSVGGCCVLMWMSHRGQARDMGFLIQSQSPCSVAGGRKGSNTSWLSLAPVALFYLSLVAGCVSQLPLTRPNTEGCTCKIASRQEPVLSPLFCDCR